jgi:hypothetical protein
MQPVFKKRISAFADTIRTEDTVEDTTTNEDQPLGIGCCLFCY